MIRTATYDDTKFKIVPLEPSEEWHLKLAQGKCEWDTAFDVITDVIAAAPEYKDKQIDLESRDFYEIMQAYRHEQLHVARRFEFVKQWLRNPTYEYQEPTKD